MLSKPYLAKCSDRTSTPKMHPSSGSPESWFRNELLSEANLLGISFDFFVNWSTIPFSLTPEIWIKRILAPAFKYEHFLINIRESLITEFGIDYLIRLADFSNKHRLVVRFVIFKDNYDWKETSRSILMISLTTGNDLNLQFAPEIINIESFKSLIKEHSGGPVKIGNKGLIYGTSNLECFLSGTDSLYPEDADLVFLNENNSPVAIIEFKKHTLSSSIDGQRLSNYYPFPDRRKYDRLGVLRDYLNSYNCNIPIITIYYPTMENSTEGSIELLGGTIGNLNTLSISKFRLPSDQSKKQEEVIIKKVVETIEQYKNFK